MISALGSWVVPFISVFLKTHGETLVNSLDVDFPFFHPVPKLLCCLDLLANDPGDNDFPNIRWEAVPFEVDVNIEAKVTQEFGIFLVVICRLVRRLFADARA